MATSELVSGFTDKIKEQEWFQQLQSSYQQLGPEQQGYVKWGSIGAAALIFFYITYGILTNANSLKAQYFEKQEMLQLVNQAGDEIRRLKGQNAGLSQGGQSWKSVAQNWAAAQGLAPESIDVTKEAPGATQNIIQETLLEVQVKGVSIRPLVQMLFQIEHSTPPVKIKGLQIESGADGLLNAKLNLSGFMPKAEKK